ncbi:group II intron reverse transcriptase/maturase [Chungangia koreensis]|uniref:RNA-directed DNA polymerase n=1 Tax=Chungangia koreensis TaxID=752657 RepID=A0ABV8X151_9LACT
MGNWHKKKRCSRKGNDGMLMERILSRENMLSALKRVEKNKGSHGVDGMPVQKLRKHIVEHWEEVKAELLMGTYQPLPVRRVEIPKPDGGVRLLGIPTVMDRFIQQAIAQVLNPIYDPTFSEHSYGFRPDRSAHGAVRKAKGYIEEGHRWVVDMDLEKFFDRVNHDRLMGTLAKRIQDKRVLKLIRAYLKSGIMIHGVVTRNEEGTPQGGPLSPLLSNIVLDELDKELEKRGHRFVRYADDCNIYVKTRRAGLRVLQSVTTFIERKLKLRVNQEKSAVDRPWKRKFLGFSFTNGKVLKVRIHKKSIERMKKRIREITSRKKPYTMEYRIGKLNQYLKGWCGYFALADTPSILKHLDSWIRRRLRMCMWKDWKNPRTRVRKLIGIGVPQWKAYEWGNSRKGYWRVSNSPIMHRTLGNSFWSSQGLESLYFRYESLRQSS